MEPRTPPVYNLEVSADRASVKDVVKAVLHTIFFHRYFTPLYPATHDVLDLTLPYVSSEDVETLIETRTTTLLRHLSTSPNSTLIVQFLEKKRKKTVTALGWFSGASKSADDEQVWENWVVDVTLLAAQGEGGAKNRRLMEKSLQKCAMKVVGVVQRERAHIPPITSNDSNPFPFQILVNPKEGGSWAGRGSGV